jgi:stage V sporulation protein AD
LAKIISNRTIIFEQPPLILGGAAVAGDKESKGPLGKLFNQIFTDDSLDTDSYEKAEMEFQRAALRKAAEKSQVPIAELNMIFAGDLLNQCAASAYAISGFDIPYLGQYGACSTMAQALLLAAITCDSGAAKTAACITSSHFCTAERQYRMPIVYGGQRTPTSQWTVTGAGCCIIGAADADNFGEISLTHNEQPIQKKPKHPFAVKIASGIFGKILDYGIADAANMGAAMAPAAADTFLTFFKNTNTTPADYDTIYTGDLGETGSKLLYELMTDDGFDISKNHQDCGLLIFDKTEQDVHSGGSGAGCSSAVLGAYILPRLQSGGERNILFMATGALMSPTVVLQGENIPCVAHLLNIVAE